MNSIVDDAEIDTVRAASRKLARSWGFLNDTLAGSDLSPSAVHALIELGEPVPLTATDLCHALSLEKSSVSRMLKKLEASGLVIARADGADARVKPLRLTAKGRRVLSAIDRFAVGQVRTALDKLPGHERMTLPVTLSRYADALAGDAMPSPTPDPVRIVTGYRPGVIGRCLELQARYYAEHVSFGQVFETGRANDIADFFDRGSARSEFWSALRGETVVGTIAIDTEGIGANAAQLRWFILDDATRGAGVGRKLLHKALDFCDEAGFAETHLWTFAGLDAARHLYEASGFVLVDEETSTDWGPPVRKQHFVRRSGGRPTT